MECSRKIIYFTVYENGVKVRPAGFMSVISGGGSCDVQIFYRGGAKEEEYRLQPVYVFLDGSVFLGEEFPVTAGEGMVRFRSGTADFVDSGRSIEELEAVYLDGMLGGICVGRIDGREPVEAACTRTEGQESGNREKTKPNKTKKEQSLPWWFLFVLLLKNN